MRVRLGTWAITDEHPASSYGKPVLVNSRNETFGPDDLVISHGTWPVEPARLVVDRMKRKQYLTEEERTFVDKFIY